MKSLLKFLPLIAVVSFASGAFAADEKVGAEATHDVSKNPITGTVTETSTHESMAKSGDHKKTKKHKKKTKTKTDGSSETKTETSIENN